MPLWPLPELSVPVPSSNVQCAKGSGSGLGVADGVGEGTDVAVGVGDGVGVTVGVGSTMSPRVNPTSVQLDISHSHFKKEK